MKYNYTTRGTCSRSIEIEVDDNRIVRHVAFNGGCAGNTQGVCRLAEGLKIDEIISRIEGIKCGAKPTSCPDQLARALRHIKEQL